MTQTRNLWIVVAALMLGIGAQESYARQPSAENPVALEANNIGYDQKNAIVVARGDVEIVQGDYVLRADQITYYQNTAIIRAQGNVSVLQPGGEVMFADEVELTDDLKTGLVQHFKIRLADQSRFAAREAVRENQYRTKLSKAVYSPCNLCKNVAPFWQLRADKIDIDEFNEQVTYNNAWMEIKGVPVAYIPRMSHPTPDADAKSGFLAPEYSVNNLFGLTIKAPYYWRIAPNQEALVTPWYTAEDGALLQTEYTYLTDESDHTVSFSGAFPERRNNTGSQVGGNEFRGHLFAKGDYAFNPTWTVGYDINRTSDDTYLRRYGFGDQAVLFSRAYVEGARGRNFATAQGLAIQGLRAFDDPDTTPLVLPTLEGYYESAPNSFGMKYFTSANAQIITRESGADQSRLSNTIGVNLPYVSSGGHVITSSVSLRGDVYDSKDVSVAGNPQALSGSETRVIPVAAVEWRYPLIRRMAASSITVEPLMLAVAQPSGNNSPQISNEDSRVVELTDTNIFSIDRFPGIDAVDSGPRVSYGLRAQYLADNNDALELLLGQSFNADDDTPFPNSNEQGENLSDYIGRVAYTSDRYFLAYRFALDKSKLSANRNELGGSYSFKRFSISGNYLSITNNAFLGESEQAFGALSLPIYQGFSASLGATRDLSFDQMLSQEAGILYQNECFNLALLTLRTFTRDRDIEPNTQFTVRIGLKNLGEFGGQ